MWGERTAAEQVVVNLMTMREIQQMALAGFFWRVQFSCVINIMKRV
jgi:hypothetical protein